MKFEDLSNSLRHGPCKATLAAGKVNAGRARRKVEEPTTNARDDRNLA